MLTVHRYLWRECLNACLMSLGVLLGVVLALFLAELLADAAQGRMPAVSLLVLLLLRIPEGVMLVGPLALLTGLLLALGRLDEQRELVVLRVSGLGWSSFSKPLAGLTVLWAVGLLLVAGWLAPLAVDRSAQILSEVARQAVLAGLRPGQFVPMEQGRLTVYVGTVDQSSGSVGDLFIHHQGLDGPEIITAARGQLRFDAASGARYLTLEDGQQVRHPAAVSGGPLRELEFKRNELRLPDPEAHAATDAPGRATLPALWPPSEPAERRELHWRLAPAIAAVGLGLLAVPLARRRPGQGRFGPVMLALILYLVYSNLVHVALIGMDQRDSMSGPGLWPVHALVLAAGLLLAWRDYTRW